MRVSERESKNPLLYRCSGKRVPHSSRAVCGSVGILISLASIRRNPVSIGA
jgi:hypothetical protein